MYTKLSENFLNLKQKTKWVFKTIFYIMEEKKTIYILLDITKMGNKQRALLLYLAFFKIKN